MRYTEGYDTEEIDIDKDLLDRKRLASSIFKTIDDTPNDWSVRLALYGKWGDGKTTLLHYLKSLAEEHNYPFIYFRISIYSNPNELWAAFLVTLLEELHSQGYDISNALSFNWVPDWFVELLPTKLLLKVTSFSANVNSSINHDLTNSALQLIINHLKIDTLFMHRLQKQLKGKKIIFAIDDFDRLPPQLVPQFLTTLREILNLPHFAFVLAMDRDKTADAIKHQHPNFGTGHPFLEKIIDFPYILPTPNAEQVNLLFEDQLRTVVGIEPKAGFKPVMPYLPSNPRKLKLVSRNIKILKDELSRHSDDEIKWEIVLTLCVLRANSQHAYDIITKELTNDEIFNLMFIEDESKRNDAINDKIRSIVDSCKDIPKDNNNLRKLLKYFFDNYYYFKSNNLHYYVNLIVKPHFLTWKEFNSLLDFYHSQQSNKPILDWVNHIRKERNEREETAIVAELFESATNYYADQLGKAADSTLVTELQKYIDNAKKSLSFIEELFNSIDEYKEKEFFVFLDKMLAWQHFQVNKDDSELRNAEQELISKLLTQSNRFNKIEIFYGLVNRRDNLSDFPFGERNDKPKLDFIISLLEQTPEVLTDLEDEIKKEDALRTVKLSSGRSALGYILLSNDSILFKNDNIKLLDEIASQSDKNLSLYNNLKLYLDLLCEYISHGRLSNKVAELVAPILWSAVTSRELQFRGHSRLLQQRNSLIDAGVTEDKLPRPQWLKEENVDQHD